MLVEITNRYFKTASNHTIVKVINFFYSVHYRFFCFTSLSDGKLCAN